MWIGSGPTGGGIGVAGDERVATGSTLKAGRQIGFAIEVDTGDDAARLGDLVGRQRESHALIFGYRICGERLNDGDLYGGESR